MGLDMGSCFFPGCALMNRKKAFDVSYRKRHVKKASIENMRNCNQPLSSAEDPQ